MDAGAAVDGGVVDGDDDVADLDAAALDRGRAVVDVAKDDVLAAVGAVVDPTTPRKPSFAGAGEPLGRPQCRWSTSATSSGSRS